jgi:hypothetical protein
VERLIMSDLQCFMQELLLEDMKSGVLSLGHLTIDVRENPQDQDLWASNGV